MPRMQVYLPDELYKAVKEHELPASELLQEAVDALVVEMAEPGGTVLTGDTDDLEALASHAAGVVIESV